MIKSCGKFGVRQVNITRINGVGKNQAADDISIEEPLQISLVWDDGRGSQTKTVAITMRTPGNDECLAVGFLLTEGIIHSAGDVNSIRADGPNAVTVILNRGVPFDSALLDRHSYVSSSCGACGKRSIAAVRVARLYKVAPGVPVLTPEVIHTLPNILREAQAEFSLTGGLHASSLFSPRGTLVALQEDVGRHNALDKLIGSELLAENLPLSNRILLLSGRVSFELVQKAAIAGVPVIAAVGAPSSLAVELAAECGITLLGFVRDKRFNVYNDCNRILGCEKNTIDVAQAL